MLLLLVFVGFALATPELCPRVVENYPGYYDGFCYLFVGFDLFPDEGLFKVPQELTRDSASQYCRDHKYQLVIIDTKKVRKRGTMLYKVKKNDYIMYVSGYFNQVWMGLTCKGNNATLCSWDNHKPLLPGYSNFISGHPNSQLGECVSYESPIGWYSTPCDQKTIFACSRSVFLTNVPPNN